MDYKEKLKAIINSDNTPFVDIDTFLKYFPELRESEDERIRKAFREHLTTFRDNYGRTKWYGGIKIDDAIAWLKKQGEQKSAIIIPKFRVGDEIKTSNEEPLTITKIDEKGYWSEDLFICSFDDAAKWELVEQKPAWSEEDEDYINDLIKYFSQNERLKNTTEDIVIWLKSLRPQSHYKPSDEQMEALWAATESYLESDNEKVIELRGKVLESLYNDLKKL